MTTRVLPRFWHGDDMAIWDMYVPVTLGRLMQIEQQVWIWSKTVAVKQP